MPVHVDCVKAPGGEANAPSGDEADTNFEITSLWKIATCFVTEKRGDGDQEFIELDVEGEEDM